MRICAKKYYIIIFIYVTNANNPFTKTISGHSETTRFFLKVHWNHLQTWIFQKSCASRAWKLSKRFEKRTATFQDDTDHEYCRQWTQYTEYLQILAYNAFFYENPINPTWIVPKLHHDAKIHQEKHKMNHLEQASWYIGKFHFLADLFLTASFFSLYPSDFCSHIYTTDDWFRHEGDSMEQLSSTEGDSLIRCDLQLSKNHQHCKENDSRETGSANRWHHWMNSSHWNAGPLVWVWEFQTWWHWKEILNSKKQIHESCTEAGRYRCSCAWWKQFTRSEPWIQPFGYRFHSRMKNTGWRPATSQSFNQCNIWNLRAFKTFNHWKSVRIPQKGRDYWSPFPSLSTVRITKNWF